MLFIDDVAAGSAGPFGDTSLVFLVDVRKGSSSDYAGIALLSMDDISAGSLAGYDASSVPVLRISFRNDINPVGGCDPWTAVFQRYHRNVSAVTVLPSPISSVKIPSPRSEAQAIMRNESP